MPTNTCNRVVQKKKKYTLLPPETRDHLKARGRREQFFAAINCASAKS